MKALAITAEMVVTPFLGVALVVFMMEWLPDLIAAVRLAVRGVRLLFLAIGWAVVIARLIL